MNERWWEAPARFLADWWWLCLIILVLLITAYFTRSYWLPVIGLTG